MNARWVGIGLFLILCSLTLNRFSDRFSYSYEVIEQPALWLVAGLIVAAAAYLFLPRLIRATLETDIPSTKWLIFWIVLAGLGMRIALFGSTPAFEDDHYRYLWDGAVTANGGNPYAHSPDDVWQETVTAEPYASLAKQSGTVLERVNYPEYRTIYPPVTQAAFALAHWIKPWSLDAWRLVVLLGEATTLALLAALLAALGRPSLWLAVYWWNPVVIKELYNSTHMEAVVLPFVVGGLLLAVKHRAVLSTVALTLGAGAKLWPVLLLIVPWRGLLAQPVRLAAAVTLSGGIAALFAWPILATGLDTSSGFVAYGQKWAANDALFQALHWLVGTALSILPGAAIEPGMAARGLAAGIVVATAIWMNRTEAATTEDFCRRVFVIVTVLFLVSPTQYPWYFIWVAPFLVFYPVTGLIVLTATMPLYYSYFHLAPREMVHVFKHGIVWFIWVPVWLLLLRDWWFGRSLEPVMQYDDPATHPARP